MITWLLRINAIILAITGCAKLITLCGTAQILNTSDPFFGIPYRYLLPSIGTIELFIAYLCIFSSKRSLSIALTAWLGTSFVAYRLGLILVGYRKPCSCLGQLTDVLHIRPKIADDVMKILLCYILISSYAGLLWIWREQWKKGGSQTPINSFTTTLW